jgi:hypothetical protein
MQRFEVIITGEGLERALTALNDAGIPTMGPTFWFGDQSDPPRVGNLMFAVLDATAAGEAVARVSAVLGKEGGNYNIDRGVTFEPEDWKNRRESD